MQHEYRLLLTWTGNKGQGTQNYTAYERSYTIASQGKPDILGSSDPSYRGDEKRWNPEELLLSSLSSCHMLWYLHLCASHKITVTEYLDAPYGIMIVEPSGTGRFQKVILNPTIKITDEKQIELAKNLHSEAHHKCFIAQSVNFPVEVQAQICGESLTP